MANAAASTEPEEPPLFRASGQARQNCGPVTISVAEFRIAPGRSVAIRGPSGIGKSTLFRGWFGLAPYDVSWDGTRAFAGAPWPGDDAQQRRLLRESICVVPQDVRAAFDPLRTLGAQLRELTANGDVAAALAELAIDDPATLLRRYPHELSGGQTQAMALALAMLRAPRLVIADEPSLGLDPRRIAELVVRLQVLRAHHGAALLLTSHDEEFLRALGVDASWTIGSDRRLRDDADLATRQASGSELDDAARRGQEWDDGLIPAARSIAPADPSAPLLAVDAVGYVRAGRTMLAPVSFELAAGESLAIRGPIGVGKTTLARILMGELRPSLGVVRRSGGCERRGAVQMLAQDAHASLTPGRSVRSLLRETAVPGFDPHAMAAALGLPSAVFDRSAAQLSGGERRRVALLRALSVEPRLLILDEPTADLDAETAREVVRAIVACQRRVGLATLWITHDRELACAVSSRVIELTSEARSRNPAVRVPL